MRTLVGSVMLSLACIGRSIETIECSMTLCLFSCRVLCIERPWDINGTGLDVWSVVSHGMKVAAMPRIWADIQIPRRRHDEDRGLDRLDIYRT